MCTLREMIRDLVLGLALFQDNQATIALQRRLFCNEQYRNIGVFAAVVWGIV